MKRVINFSQYTRQHFFKEVRKSNKENRPLSLLCLYSGVCMCLCGAGRSEARGREEDVKLVDTEDALRMVAWGQGGQTGVHLAL